MTNSRGYTFVELLIVASIIMILASATDISTGSRFVFSQQTFDAGRGDLRD